MYTVLYANTLYKKEDGKKTTTALFLNPENQTVWVEQKKETNSWVTIAELIGKYLVLDFEKGKEKFYPEPKSLRRFLESPEGQLLLEKWDTTKCFEERVMVRNILLEAIYNLPRDQRIVWTLEEWFEPYLPFINGDETDEEIEKIALDAIDNRAKNDYLDFTDIAAISYLKTERNYKKILK